MSKPVYLDYSATTPVDPRVAQKMSACLLTEGNFGNPASKSHVFGWRAEEAVEEAREHVARLLNCDPREIVWTSGATESDNLALKGVAEFYGTGRRHIVTSAIEHKAVLDTCKYLQEKGFEVTYLEPSRNGQIEPAQVRAALRPNTLMVSVMHANNEIGTIQPLAEISKIPRAAGVYFHTDAVQAAAYLPVDVRVLNVELLALGAHKFYGPLDQGMPAGSMENIPPWPKRNAV